jgi:5-methylcytosine-specific restriction endonuclease McrA
MTVIKSTKAYYKLNPDINKEIIKCSYCNEVCSDHGGFTVDHFYNTISKKNKLKTVNELVNLKPCCAECNNMKADYSPRTFLYIINFLYKNRRRVKLENYSNKRLDIMKNNVKSILLNKS